MKIPSKIKVGGHIFKVEITELENMGETDVRKNTISISNSIPKDQQESTLIHELLHAINSTWGSERMSHIALDSISEQLYQVLSDAKMLK